MRWCALVAGLVLYASCAAGQILTESYFLYLNSYPSDRQYKLSKSDPQGLAHDDENWYYTKQITLYKIPVTNDLNDEDCWTTNALVFDVPGGDFIHFGDPDCIKYRDRWFVFVPLEDSDPPQDEAIAVYNATNLALVDVDYVSTNQDYRAGWVAVHPVLTTDKYAYVYSSASDNVGYLVRYRVNMETLYETGVLNLEWDTNVDLFYGDGNPMYFGGHMQGGEFSTSGDLLYLVSGLADNPSWNHGIWVFDTRTWKAIRWSSIDDMPFRYQWDYSYTIQDEPEGLTIWDLDDGRAPGIKGQMHVIMASNDLGSDDDLYIKHYTHKIYVDAATGNDNDFGRPETPLASVTQAVVQAWNGQELVLQAGGYPVPVTVTQRLRIVSQGGAAFIGGSP